MKNSAAGAHPVFVEAYDEAGLIVISYHKWFHEFKMMNLTSKLGKVAEGGKYVKTWNWKHY